MQDERAKERELADFEAQLAALVPRAEVDRDQLMFEAGSRAARKRLLVVNRLLAAACLLLVVTTVAPLAMRERADVVAKEEPQVGPPSASETIKEAETKLAETRELPNQLIVADSRELAAALAGGRSDLQPGRLRDPVGEKGGEVITHEADGSRPKSSRVLLLEYLDANGERL